MFSDSHMHTSFSADSKAEPQEMVEAAIARGMRSICFTDHHDIDFVSDAYLLDAERYMEKMTSLAQQYRGRIDIRIGVEVGMQPHLHDEVLKFVESRPFDFVIGSLHMVGGLDPYYRDTIPFSDEELYARYFEETLACVRNIEGVQALGHLDYAVRYGYEKEKSYHLETHREVIDAILEELIKRDIALEVNTAGFKAGLPFPNPHPDIIRRYISLGGELVTLGADAHRPEHVGYAYDRIGELLRDCGVKRIAEFTGKKPEFVPVDNEMS